MFVRTKKSGKHTYLQIVYSERMEGRVRQHLVGTLGRLDVLQQTGELDALMVSMQQFSEKLGVIGATAKAEARAQTFRHIGAAMVFDRLWRELGIDRVLKEQLRGRLFGFSIERVLFVTTLHRLLAPGSDRQAGRWKKDYRIEGAD
jgi:hypothetical protein